MIATVLWLCVSASNCNAYYVDHYVDHADTQSDCMINLVNHSTKMANVWHNDRDLSAFLKKNNIHENVKMLNDYDYTCEFVPDSQIP